MLHNRFLTYLLIAIFAISAVFTACKPDDDENGNEKVQLVKTITTYDTYGSLDFEYDKKNRITAVYLRRGEMPTFPYFQFFYTGNDLVKCIAYSDGSYYICEFSKKGNEITVFNSFMPECIIKLNDDGYPLNFYDITFQYLNSNMVSAKDDNSNYSWYKYDNNKSPFWHCETPKWVSIFISATFFSFQPEFFVSFKNNITEHYSNINSSEHTCELSYEYDDNGFPTQMYIDDELWVSFTY